MRHSFLKTLTPLLALLFFPLIAHAGFFKAVDPGAPAAAAPTGKANLGSVHKGPQEKRFRQDEILVKFKAGVADSGRKNLHKKHGSQRLKKYDYLRLERLRLKKGISVPEAVKLYQNDPAVEYAEPNYAVSVLAAPNDPSFPDLWGLYNTGQGGGVAGADIDALTAWQTTTGNGNVVVAVIDSGIDYTHDDLKDNLWVNTAERDGETGKDDDGNGYVDDIYGFNAVADSGDPRDDHGHGTHVAGTIGAQGNNALGVVGVNWEVGIMSCKFLDETGSGWNSDAIECLTYIRTMKARGVNIVATSNSWGGGGYSQALYDAINAQQDILFVAAAGNDGFDNDVWPTYPSGYSLPNLISVAATDSMDGRAYFSNYGRRSVAVGAPGSGILSTLPPTNIWGLTGGYGYLSGTSMATPHVSGLAALLKAQSPSRDWKALKNLILSGGDPNPALAGKTITGRRINAAGSMGCSGRPVFSTLTYPLRYTVGVPVTLSALSINCALPAGPVTATNDEGAVIATLLDNGVGEDKAAGDGIFTAVWVPTRPYERLTFAGPGGSETFRIPIMEFLSISLDEGNINIPYAGSIQVMGGKQPYSWAVVDGALPPGLSLSSSTGEISGIPTREGSYGFTIRVSDAAGSVISRWFSIHVVDDYVLREWVRIYDAGADEEAWGVSLDSAGNVYVVGGYAAFTTVKYDPAGNLLWEKSLGSRGIIVDAGGNIYFSAPQLAKYDPDGTLLWTRSESYTKGVLALDSAGNSIVATANTLAKLSPAGQLLWTRNYQGSDGVQYSRAVTTDSSGSIIVTGGRGSFVHTVKYDSSGTPLWHYTTDFLWSTAEGVAADAAGNVYIAGEYYDQVEKFWTFFTMKYGPTGTPLWTKNYGEGRLAGARGVTVDPRGDILVTGDDTNYIVTLKYDGDGNVIWKRSYNCSVWEWSSTPHAITTDGNGAVYVAGRGICGSPLNYNPNNMVDFITIKYRDHFSQLRVVTTSFPPAAVGVTYSQKLAASGGSLPCSWEITAGSLPPGLSLDPASGAVSGVPTATGTFAFTAQVRDHDGGTVVKELSIAVYQPLQISAISLPLALGNTPYSKAIEVSGGSLPYRWEVFNSTLPEGLTLDAATGALEGIPTRPGYYYTFTIRVTDAAGVRVSRNYTLSVFGIYTSSLSSGLVGAAYSQQLEADGSPTHPYAWSVPPGTMPPGLSLSASGLISGIPTATGVFAFSPQVSDATGNLSSKQLTVAVTSAPLTVTPLTLQNGNVGFPYQQQFSASGGFPPYTWSAAPGTLPPGLSLAAGTGLLSGTPTAAGIYTVSLQAADTQGGTVGRSFPVTIGLMQYLAGWGYNQQGQLGDGTTTQRLTASPIPGFSDLALISGNFAVRNDGTLWGWGANSYGQVGDGTNAEQHSPVAVAISAAVTGMVQGATHTLARRSDGSVWSWGDNSKGTLGIGSWVGRSTPGKVSTVSGLTSAVSVSAGMYHSLAVKSDGSVYVWGDNDYGQLGTGGNLYSPSPTRLGLSSFSAVAAGLYFSLALRSDGTVWGWGDNGGQLGDGTTVRRYSPVQVTGLNGITITAIAAGNSHSLGLSSDGTVWAWGNNSSGQLGDGTTTMRSVPVQVPGLGGIVAIAAGSAHSLALGSDGRVWTWGYNGSGQLGDGTTVNRLIPTPVPGIVKATAISAGSSCSFALMPFALLTPVLPTATTGNSYLQKVSTTGTPSAWEILTGSLPAGLTLNPATGVIGGLTEETGTFRFTLRAVSGDGEVDSREITLQVSPPLVITTAFLDKAIVGSLYGQTLAASGGLPPYSWSVTSGVLPYGTALDAATGVVSGTPQYNGTYTFSVSVSDSGGLTTTLPLSLTTYSADSVVSIFSGTPLNGQAPLLVSFTDASHKSPTSWSWTFGDGGASTERNPVHVYTAPGSYAVSLRAVGASSSDTTTKTGYITVLACPNSPVRIRGRTGTAFTVPAAAYLDALDNEVLELQALDYSGDLLLDRDIRITLKGGYDCGYNDTPSSASINGALRVKNGTVKPEKLRFK
jgi:alpha-tubulin suppressor-like RCC1 family protein/subtilisin family serine protease